MSDTGKGEQRQQGGRQLFRLDTPPLVREYRERAEKTESGFSVKPLRISGGASRGESRDSENSSNSRASKSGESASKLDNASNTSKPGSHTWQSEGAGNSLRGTSSFAPSPSSAFSKKSGSLGGSRSGTSDEKQAMLRGLASDDSGMREPSKIITQSNGVRTVIQNTKFQTAPPNPPSVARTSAAAASAASGRPTLQLDLLTDFDGDKIDSDGYASSPNSLTACSRSNTTFGGAFMDMSRMSELDLDDQKHYMYFGTGVKASDLLDSASNPPQYKSQYTVTGQVRQVKLKREGPPLGKSAEVNGETVALFKYKGMFYAIKNSCCHQGGPLFQGDIEDIQATVYKDGSGGATPRTGPCVACPWHGWRFDLRSGKCLNKTEYQQTVFPCRVDHGEVQVGFESFDHSNFDADEDF